MARQRATLKASQVAACLNVYKPPPGHEAAHRRALPRPVLKDEQATGPQQPSGRFTDGGEVRKAALGGKQRGGRLEAQHLVHDFAPLPLTYIRRIADNKVEGPGAQRRRKKVAAHAGEARFSRIKERLGVFPRHGKGLAAFFHQEPPPQRPFAGQRDADAAAARAQVRKTDASSRQEFQRRLHQKLGLGPRHKRMPRDVEIPAEKFPHARDMGPRQRYSLLQPQPRHVTTLRTSRHTEKS